MMRAEGYSPAISTPAPVPPAPPAIIDVEKSFRDATKKYTLLEQTASTLISDLTTATPRQILQKSQQLAKMQRNMISQDDQLVAITALAGAEILHSLYVKEYRRILATAILRCDQLWEQLSLIKKNLLKASTIDRNLDSFDQD